MNVKRTADRRPFTLDLSIKSVAAQPDGSLVLQGYASTYSTDRDKEAVAPQALRNAIAKYLTNPMLLFQHSPDQVLGNVTKATVDNVGLWIEAVIPPPATGCGAWLADAFNGIKNGLYHAFSIGGIFDRVKDAIVGMDLMEISVVSIPAQPEALFDVVQKAYDLTGKAIAHTTMKAHFHTHEDGAEHTHAHQHDAGESSHDTPTHNKHKEASMSLSTKTLPTDPTPAVGMYGDPPEGSYEDLHDDLERAAQQFFGGGMTMMGGPLITVTNLATFPDYCVISVPDGSDTDYYEVGYVIGEDGEPIMTEHREVNLVYVPAAPDTDPGTGMQLSFKPTDGTKARDHRLPLSWATGDGAAMKSGRVLSKANEDALRAAIESLSKVIDALESRTEANDAAA